MFTKQEQLGVSRWLAFVHVRPLCINGPNLKLFSIDEKAYMFKWETLMKLRSLILTKEDVDLHMREKMD